MIIENLTMSITREVLYKKYKLGEHAEVVHTLYYPDNKFVFIVRIGQGCYMHLPIDKGDVLWYQLLDDPACVSPVDYNIMVKED